MRRLAKLLPVILALWGGTLCSQVVLTSIPEPVDGVVEVCLGSTVLFLNETDESQLNLNGIHLVLAGHIDSRDMV